jgi:chromosome segregation ATPase
MKKYTLFFLLFFSPLVVYGQQSSDTDTSFVASKVFQQRVAVLKGRIDSLTNLVANIKQKNDDLGNRLQQNQAQLESLAMRLKKQKSIIVQTNKTIDSLNQRIAQKINVAEAEMAGLKSETKSKFSAFTTSFSVRKWWVIGAILFVFVISVIGFVAVKEKGGKDKKELDDRFTKRSSRLENKIAELEEVNKSDTKLLEALNEKIETVPSPSEEKEVDHSIALAAALEIIRMRKRVELMDADTKGLKSLTKALERLEDELEIKGYEIIDLEGQKYHDGMNVKANFVPDEELKENEAIITRTIKPQVNYNGKAIQHADIQVATGTKK